MKLPAKTLAEAKPVLDGERPELDPARPEDRRLYVERDAVVHDRAHHQSQGRGRKPAGIQLVLYGAHGHGESTELNRIVRNNDLASRYIPHIYRVRDSLDVHNLDFTDIILGIAQSVADLTTDRGVAVPKKLQERMRYGARNGAGDRFSPEGRRG